MLLFSSLTFSSSSICIFSKFSPSFSSLSSSLFSFSLYSSLLYCSIKASIWFDKYSAVSGSKLFCSQNSFDKTSGFESEYIFIFAVFPSSNSKDITYIGFLSSLCELFSLFSSLSSLFSKFEFCSSELFISFNLSCLCIIFSSFISWCFSFCFLFDCVFLLFLFNFSSDLIWLLIWWEFIFKVEI